MHLTQDHLHEQNELEGELTNEEREEAIIDGESLKEKIKAFNI